MQNSIEKNDVQINFKTKPKKNTTINLKNKNQRKTYYKKIYNSIF